jgi:archaemetzincin
VPAAVRVLCPGGRGVRRLERVVGEVGEALALPVRVEQVELDLEATFDRSRRQYNSTLLLEQVLNLGGGPGERRVAVVDVDLHIPVLAFVFGEAMLSGPAAVVSTHRLANSYYGLPRDEALLTRRLAKELVHELGHTLGLRHCRQFECVMRTSTHVGEIDLKRGTLCGACADEVRARLAAATERAG